MISYAIAAVVLLLTLAALGLGIRLAAFLPSHHLINDARDSAKVGIGMLATLLALVLGLMITSAKRSFDEREAELVQTATSIVLLDRTLLALGQEAQPARSRLRQVLDDITRLASREGRHDVDDKDWFRNLRAVSELQQTILSLSPHTDAQKWHQARAMQLSTTIAHDRVLVAEHGTSTVPTALLVVVTGWVTVIYFGFGVFLVGNRSVYFALCICAVAFACSIFIILELDTPFSGVVGVSDRSLIRAQTELAQEAR
ncbi:MAG: hypothetical protein J7605_16165 [Variovorax sp.]|nr:hypothetical protein [Variovorax sp.]